MSTPYEKLTLLSFMFSWFYQNRRIHADVIVYIFAHFHTALCAEGNMLDMKIISSLSKIVFQKLQDF